MPACDLLVLSLFPAGKGRRRFSTFDELRQHWYVRYRYHELARLQLRMYADKGSYPSLRSTIYRVPVGAVRQCFVTQTIEPAFLLAEISCVGDSNCVPGEESELGTSVETAKRLIGPSRNHLQTRRAIRIHCDDLPALLCSCVVRMMIVRVAPGREQMHNKSARLRRIMPKRPSGTQLRET